MAAASIIDDINAVLKRQREQSEYAYVKPENINAFFVPAAPAQPILSPAPSTPRQSITRPAAATIIPTEVTVTPVVPALPPTHAPELPSTLDELRCMSDSCTRCKLHTGRTNGVFGEGNPHAELMFIGEGPGYEEDRQGRPFVGKAGQLLTKMIEAMQFTREEVYIANIVKCRPPDNRNPEPDEAAACIPYLQRQIELIGPRVLVLLGAVPLEHLMGIKGIRRMRGQWLEYHGIPVMPTYHPAYLLRFPEGKREVWSDLQLVMKQFNRVYKRL